MLLGCLPSVMKLTPSSPSPLLVDSQLDMLLALPCGDSGLIWRLADVASGRDLVDLHRFLSSCGVAMSACSFSVVASDLSTSSLSGKVGIDYHNACRLSPVFQDLCLHH